MKEITTHNIRLDDYNCMCRGYGGMSVIVTCPECKETIRLCEYGWKDDAVCECGYRWDFELVATGTKQDE